MKTITTSIRIDAPVATVWHVLTDQRAYPAWNPFITAFSGNLSRGERLAVTIQPPGSSAMRFRPTVTAVAAERELRWLGRVGIPGIFDGAHAFVLDETPDGGTLLTQSETFRGVLVGLMGSALERTERGFILMNDALKARSEHLAQERTA